MPITLGAYGTGVGAASGNVTPTLPAGWVVDDIFTIQVTARDNVVCSFPGGWTILNGTNNGTGMRTTIAWKRAVSSDTDPLVTHAAGGFIDAVVTAWRGAKGAGGTSSPFSVVGTPKANASSATITANGITPLVGDGVIFFAGSLDPNASIVSNMTEPSTTITREYAGSNDDWWGFATSTSGAATSPNTATGANAALNIGQLVAMTPFLTITINTPSGVTKDCAMVALVAYNGFDTTTTVASVFTDPPGWSSLYSVDPSLVDPVFTNVYQIHAAIRIASAVEPANYTWSATPPNNTTNVLVSGYIVVYENVDVATPQDAVATSATAHNSSVAAILPSPSIKTNTPNALVLSAITGSSGVVSPPRSRFNNLDGPTGIPLAAADQVAQIAGVVMPPRWSGLPGVIINTVVVATIALRPARTVWDTFAIKRRAAGATTLKPSRSNLFQRHFRRTGSTGPAQAPFYLTDWPLPRLSTFAVQLRSFSDPLKQWLTGLDTFFSGPGAGPDYDWPNPRGYTPGIALKTWADPMKVWLAGQDALPFSLADWPNPLRARDWGWVRGFADWFKNALVGADLLPFNISDWPNPLRADRYARGFLEWFKQTLLGADLLPFNLSDWPNPLRARDLGWVRGFADWFKLVLTGQDVLPFNLTDWPNPLRYIPAIELRSWLLALVNNTLIVIVYPFNLLDWPVPRGYIPAISLKTWTDVLKVWLTGLDTFFGAQGQAPANLDWPVPKGYVPGISLRTWLGDLVRTTLVGLDSLPFSLADWPNPLRVRDERHVRGFVDWFKRALIGADLLPFNLSDWPNPLRADRYARGFIDWFKNALIGADFLPFNLTDWPNPLRYIPGISLKTWLDPLKQWLAGLDILPPRLSDWPNPLRYVPAIELRTWLLNLQQSVLFGLQPPFFLLDWPVPRGYVPAISLRTFTDPLKMLLIGLDTFFGPPGVGPDYDYPNPTLKRDDINRRTWLDWYKQTLIGRDALPFNLSDWPVPKGYIPSIVLKTWADVFKVLLIARDTFFGASGQGPANLDWPVPKGYIPAIALRTWAIDLVRTTLVGLDTFFGAQGQAPANLDWPVPKGYTPGIELRTWLQSLANSTLGIVFFPFSLIDWPNPRGYTPGIVLRTWTDPLKMLLTGLDKFFGAPGQAPANLDWPVPKGYVPGVTLRTWLVSLVQNLAGQDALPFSLDDWPNPLRIRDERHIRGFVDWFKQSLLGADLLPFRLSDWPNPLRLRDERHIRGFADWFKNALVGADFLPFSLADWPNPLRADRYARGFLDWFKRSLTGLDFLPFRQPDWPVPKGYIPAIALRSWVSSIITSAYAVLTRPFALLDWPVPKGYIPSIELRTLVNNAFGTAVLGLMVPVVFSAFTAYVAVLVSRRAYYPDLLRAVTAYIAGMRARFSYRDVLKAVTAYIEVIRGRTDDHR